MFLTPKAADIDFPTLRSIPGEIFQKTRAYIYEWQGLKGSPLTDKMNKELHLFFKMPRQDDDVRIARNRMELSDDGRAVLSYSLPQPKIAPTRT